MAEFSTPEQRTELPTERRLQHLRKEGAIHLSHEVASVLSMITGFLMLKTLWPWIYDSSVQVMTRCLRAIAHPPSFEAVALRQGFIQLTLLVTPALLALMVVVAIVASIAVLLQTKFNFKERKFQLRFNLLNPISGIQRIFSVHGVFNTGKAVAKLCLMLPVAYLGLESLAPQMLSLVHTSIPEILHYTGGAMWTLFWKLTYILAALALIDYFWGKYQWLKLNKMTKDEVKDERKSIEGDEETRRKIMWKGIQRAMQRIKQGVKKADVIVTNPTHFAVALKYDRNSMDAPIVVAKGMDFMALKIRELAKDEGIPIVERRELARALYASVEVGKEIPLELFKAVAEVLAYVYRLRNPWAARQYAGAK